MTLAVRWHELDAPGALDGFVLFLYGIMPQHFRRHRIYAAYGGIHGCSLSIIFMLLNLQMLASDIEHEFL
jgi:drug/metabolite transporter superfamily protein YnfA